jgi:cytochrome b
VIGVLVTSRLHRQNLIRAMISGKKVSDSEDAA